MTIDNANLVPIINDVIATLDKYSLTTGEIGMVLMTCAVATMEEIEDVSARELFRQLCHKGLDVK